jgi:GntR family transcriptional regulator, transcriptional repressor for pyruvate dehydrogenase complex
MVVCEGVVMSEAAVRRIQPELFSAVTGSRVSSSIVAQIRELIHTGELVPGDRLPPERELASQLGVSRVSVRDALRVLEVLGLLQIRVGARGGAFVTRPSSQVVGEGVANLLLTSVATPEQVAETRLVLELGIVTLACERATARDLEQLRRCCEEGRRALGEARYERHHSEAFHELLAQATHNPALAVIAASFRGPLSLHLLREQDDPDPRHRRSLRDHEALVRAMADRDVATARSVLLDHLTRGLPTRRRRHLRAAFP